MTHAQNLREIYKKEGSKVYFLGNTPVERAALIAEIVAQVQAALKLPKPGKDGHTPTDAELTKLISPLIPKVKDGHTPTDAELTRLITPLIPAPKKGDKGDDGKSVSKEDVVIMLAKMVAEAVEKIKVPEAPKPTVDELTSIIEPLIRTIVAENRGGWFGGGGGDLTGAGTGIIQTTNEIGRKIFSLDPAVIPVGTQVVGEDVTGSGTSFTLDHAPTAGTLKLFGIGQRLKEGPGNDYTISGANITTANSWSAGDLLADYSYT